MQPALVRAFLRCWQLNLAPSMAAMCWISSGRAASPRKEEEVIRVMGKKISSLCLCWIPNMVDSSRS